MPHNDPKHPQLRRLLVGCDVVAFHEADADRAGSILGKSATRDLVDAAVVAIAIERSA